MLAFQTIWHPTSLQPFKYQTSSGFRSPLYLLILNILNQYENIFCRYHSNLHDGVADFLCDDCGRGFVTRQKLLNHRRSKHTFEKPYICDQCGRGFTRSDKLTVHRRRAHTGEKPYQVSRGDVK